VAATAILQIGLYDAKLPGTVWGIEAAKKNAQLVMFYFFYILSFSLILGDLPLAVFRPTSVLFTAEVQQSN